MLSRCNRVFASNWVLLHCLLEERHSYEGQLSAVPFI